jgi:transcriptional regulator with XRE-family HTH domain
MRSSPSRSPPAPAPRPHVGALLREWRCGRRLSQLALALEADVSARHLCYVENGRAQPSPEMVGRLAEALKMPLRERNGLLVAAGYAPEHPESGLGTPELAQVGKAIDLILAQQEPYAAFVLNRHWDVVQANRATIRIFEFLRGGTLHAKVQGRTTTVSRAGVESSQRLTAGSERVGDAGRGALEDLNSAHGRTGGEPGTWRASLRCWTVLTRRRAGAGKWPWRGRAAGREAPGSREWPGQWRSDLAHEPSQGHPIAVVNAGLEPNLRHRAVDEVPQRHDAAGQHRTRAPADADCATLQGFEREVRDVDLVPELMSESAQTERLLAPARFLLEASVFGDGLGDGRVQAAIQGVKVLGTNERAEGSASQGTEKV